MLSDGSAVRLTIARYYTPTGRSIQKPYENGTKDYYNELAVRYDNGEFLEQDSIDFEDSLKFVTPGGKIVYGGGGIMPDLFVPLDTSGVTDYLMALRHRGLVYRYALEYTDDHREQLSVLTSPDAIVEYLRGKQVLKHFTAYASKNGVPLNKQEMETSKSIIEAQLYAYIARNIFDNEGFYPIIESIDNTLQIAIKELE
jgi:carboxyl-terminal processing protease